MKKISKKLLSELVRISKKYWDTGDTDILPKKRGIASEISDLAFGNEDYFGTFDDLVDGIVGVRGLKQNATVDEICEVFKLLGLEIEEEKEITNE